MRSFPFSLQVLKGYNSYYCFFSFSIVQEFTPKDGSLAEQFDRKTGNPLSASDLTWFVVLTPLGVVSSWR